MNELDQAFFEYGGKLESCSSENTKLQVDLASTIVTLSVPPEDIEYLSFQVGHLVSSLLLSGTKISFLEYSEALKLPAAALRFPSPSSDYKFSFLGFLNLVVISNSKRQSNFVLYRETSPYSSDALRVLFQMMVPTCKIPIHGGSLSWGQRAALVSNVGGSGKSSLISAALLAGAQTTGDDFGILEVSLESMRVWSQFKSFKLHQESPVFSRLDAFARNETSGKYLFDIAEVSSAGVARSHEIDVILIPRIAKRFSLRASTSKYAFSRIAPSSAGMALHKQATNLAIANLCAKIPSFVLELGPDQAENVARTREFLSR